MPALAVVTVEMGVNHSSSVTLQESAVRGDEPMHSTLYTSPVHSMVNPRVKWQIISAFFACLHDFCLT